jgi:hypothetical protein
MKLSSGAAKKAASCACSSLGGRTSEAALPWITDWRKALNFGFASKRALHKSFSISCTYNFKDDVLTILLVIHKFQEFLSLLGYS